MEVLLLSFAAGLLTVASPCILPVLPVILTGSLSGTSKWKPFIIVASLSLSIFLFTLLLKATTTFIGVPQQFWTAVSGVIVFIFGLFLVFPDVWTWISVKLGFEHSQELIQKSQQTGGVAGDIFLGASLGPIFSSCSPTYALILATVLPQSFGFGILNLFLYVVGLAIPLLLIAFGGQKIVQKVKFLADPSGWFRKTLGVILVIFGFLIFTNLIKDVEAWLVEQGFLGTTLIEQDILEGVQDDMFDMGEVKEVEKVTGETTFIEQRSTLNTLRYNYPAPEFRGLGTWFNSEPLMLKDLKGKVVLVDFWTFSCINCIRTLPFLRSMQEKYKDKGLVIVGLHAPEFAFERVAKNLEESIKKYELTYPIAMDNDFQTWRVFRNRYWPAKYLIDADGNVRYQHFGEGAYDETEEAVMALLAEVGTEIDDTTDVEPGLQVDYDQIKTPEIYFGYSRISHFGSGQVKSNEVHTYEVPEKFTDNTFYLEGEWNIGEEKAELKGNSGKIIIRYHAKEANIVLGGVGEKIIVKLDGEYLTDLNKGDNVEIDPETGESYVKIDQENLYNFTDVSGDVDWRTLEIEFTEPGVEAYAFTFG